MSSLVFGKLAEIASVTNTSSGTFSWYESNQTISFKRQVNKQISLSVSWSATPRSTNSKHWHVEYEVPGVVGHEFIRAQGSSFKEAFELARDKLKTYLANMSNSI